MKRGGFAVANPPLIRNGLFQKAEELEDEVPAFLNSGNLQFFIRRVNTTEGRTEGYHVEFGVFLGEETAFESGVDGFDGGFFVEDVFISFHQQVECL